VYADEEYTGVQALDIACCDNVDMGEFAGWEEDVSWDVWVEDYGVCVHPPVLLLVLGVSSRRESGRDVHHPFCSLRLWFREFLGDLLDHEGWLVPVSAVLVLSLDVGWVAPLLSMSDVRF